MAALKADFRAIVSAHENSGRGLNVMKANVSQGILYSGFDPSFEKDRVYDLKLKRGMPHLSAHAVHSHVPKPFQYSYSRRKYPQFSCAIYR